MKFKLIIFLIFRVFLPDVINSKYYKNVLYYVSFFNNFHEMRNEIMPVSFRGKSFQLGLNWETFFAAKIIFGLFSTWSLDVIVTRRERKKVKIIER